MSAAADIAEFLITRRARISPEQAGLPSHGQRRVPGLRREEVERAHLLDLARAAGPAAPRRSRPARTRLRPVVQRLLDQIEAPAIVSTVHCDYLAANALGRALYAPVFESAEGPANSARFTFLDPAAADFYPEWDRLATELVASLRSQAGRNPHDRNLQTLTVDADEGLRMALYTAEPDSASQQALDLLASWSATPTELRRP
jgi:hypothetical protein